MKPTARILRLVLALAILATPCAAFLFTTVDRAAAQEELPEPSTTLRVMHAAEGAAGASISIDGELAYRRLQFGEATPYKSVTPGDHEFAVEVEDAEPITISATIESGDAATVVLVSGESGVEVRTFEVNLDRTGTAEARIRLINASGDSGELDFYGNDDRWFDNVGFPDASDYKNVGWGEYDLTIRSDDEDQPVASLPATTLNWGNVYDVIFFGSSANDSLQTITLVTSVSPRCTLLLDLEGLPAEACLRIGNLAPVGLPLMDVYYNNVRILENIGRDDRIEYVAVPVFDYEVPIHIVPAGMGTDYSYSYRYVELRPGEAYEMFIVGSANSPSIVGGRVNLTPPPEGQARWRVLQGYPDAASVDIVIKDGPSIFTEVSYQDTTDYVVLDAGTYVVQIVDHETGSVLFEQEVTVEAGMVYDTVFAYTVELGGAPMQGTPVAVVGQNAAALTFISPTFPRGGILVPSAQAEGEEGEASAEATPEA